jgi:predicted nucleic acid-binding protein
VIAADTNTWIAFLEGSQGLDTQLLDQALADRQVLMVPAVLTELLSDPKPSHDIRPVLTGIPLIEIRPGYWERAGALRAKVLSKGRKARLGDALIAQACLDRGISLITRDRDFRAFAEGAGLQIVLPVRDRS